MAISPNSSALSQPPPTNPKYSPPYPRLLQNNKQQHRKVHNKKMVILINIMDKYNKYFTIHIDDNLISGIGLN